MCSCAFTHLVYALPYFNHLLVVFMVLQMQQESCRMLSAGQTAQITNAATEGLLYS